MTVVNNRINTGKDTFSFTPEILIPAPPLTPKVVSRRDIVQGNGLHKIIDDATVMVTGYSSSELPAESVKPEELEGLNGVAIVRKMKGGNVAQSFFAETNIEDGKAQNTIIASRTGLVTNGVVVWSDFIMPEAGSGGAAVTIKGPATVELGKVISGFTDSGEVVALGTHNNYGSAWDGTHFWVIDATSNTIIQFDSNWVATGFTADISSGGSDLHSLSTIVWTGSSFIGYKGSYSDVVSFDVNDTSTSTIVFSGGLGPKDHAVVSGHLYSLTSDLVRIHTLDGTPVRDVDLSGQYLYMDSLTWTGTHFVATGSNVGRVWFYDADFNYVKSFDTDIHKSNDSLVFDGVDLWHVTDTEAKRLPLTYDGVPGEYVVKAEGIDTLGVVDSSILLANGESFLVEGQSAGQVSTTDVLTLGEVLGDITLEANPIIRQLSDVGGMPIPTPAEDGYSYVWDDATQSHLLVAPVDTSKFAKSAVPGPAEVALQVEVTGITTGPLFTKLTQGNASIMWDDSDLTYWTLDTSNNVLAHYDTDQNLIGEPLSLAGFGSSIDRAALTDGKFYFYDTSSSGSIYSTDKDLSNKVTIVGPTNLAYTYGLTVRNGFIYTVHYQAWVKKFNMSGELITAVQPGIPNSPIAMAWTGNSWWVTDDENWTARSWKRLDADLNLIASTSTTNPTGMAGLTWTGSKLLAIRSDRYLVDITATFSPVAGVTIVAAPGIGDLAGVYSEVKLGNGESFIVDSILGSGQVITKDVVTLGSIAGDLEKKNDPIIRQLSDISDLSLLDGFVKAALPGPAEVELGKEISNFSASGLTVSHGLGNPYGATWDGTHFWVIDQTVNLIVQFDKDWVETGVEIDVGGGTALYGISSIAWTGSFFIGFTGVSNSLRRFTAADTVTVDVFATDGSPEDIEVVNGLLYAVDGPITRIHDMDGTLIRTVDTSTPYYHNKRIFWTGTHFVLCGTTSDSLYFWDADFNFVKSVSNSAHRLSDSLVFDGEYLWHVDVGTNTQLAPSFTEIAGQYVVKAEGIDSFGGVGSIIQLANGETFAIEGKGTGQVSTTDVLTLGEVLGDITLEADPIIRKLSDVAGMPVPTAAEDGYGYVWDEDSQSHKLVELAAPVDVSRFAKSAIAGPAIVSTTAEITGLTKEASAFATLTGRDNCWGICWDGTHFWMIPWTPKTMYQYDADWVPTGVSVDISSIADGRGIDFSAGKFYVQSSAGLATFELDGDNAMVNATVIGDLAISSAYGISVGSNCIIVTAYSKTAHRYTLDGALIETYDVSAVTGNYPYGIAWDGYSFWLAGGDFNTTIGRYDSDFNFIETVPGGMAKMTGFCFDDSDFWMLGKSATSIFKAPAIYSDIGGSWTVEAPGIGERSDISTNVILANGESFYVAEVVGSDKVLTNDLLSTGTVNGDIKFSRNPVIRKLSDVAGMPVPTAAEDGYAYVWDEATKSHKLVELAAPVDTALFKAGAVAGPAEVTSTAQVDGLVKNDTIVAPQGSGAYGDAWGGCWDGEHFWLHDWSDHHLTQFDAQWNETGVTVSAGDAYTAVDDRCLTWHEGRFYATKSNKLSSFIVDSQTGAVSDIQLSQLIDGLGAVYGIAVSNDVVHTIRHTGEVHRIHIDGTFIDSFSIADQTGTSPDSITWDGTNIWVSGSTSTHRYDADFNFIETLSGMRAVNTRIWDGSSFWETPFSYNSATNIYRLDATYVAVGGSWTIKAPGLADIFSVNDKVLLGNGEEFVISELVSSGEVITSDALTTGAIAGAIARVNNPAIRQLSDVGGLPVPTAAEDGYTYVWDEATKSHKLVELGGSGEAVDTSLLAMSAGPALTAPLAVPAGLASSGSSIAMTTGSGNVSGGCWDGSDFWVYNTTNMEIVQFDASWVATGVVVSVLTVSESNLLIGLGYYDGNFIFYRASTNTIISVSHAGDFVNTLYSESSVLTGIDCMGVVNSHLYVAVGSDIHTIDLASAAKVKTTNVSSATANDIAAVTFDGHYLLIVPINTSTVIQVDLDGGQIFSVGSNIPSFSGIAIKVESDYYFGTKTEIQKVAPSGYTSVPGIYTVENSGLGSFTAPGKTIKLGDGKELLVDSILDANTVSTLEVLATESVSGNIERVYGSGEAIDTSLFAKAAIPGPAVVDSQTIVTGIGTTPGPVATTESLNTGGIFWDGEFYWLTNTVADQIFKLDSSWNVLERSASTASLDDNLYGLGKLSNGRFVSFGSSSDQLISFNPDLSGMTVITSDASILTGSSGGGLVVVDDYIYICTDADGKIKKIDSTTGLLVKEVAPAGMTYPSKIVWDGNSFWAFEGGEWFQFNKDLDYIAQFATTMQNGSTLGAVIANNVLHVVGNSIRSEYPLTTEVVPGIATVAAPGIGSLGVVGSTLQLATGETFIVGEILSDDEINTGAEIVAGSYPGNISKVEVPAVSLDTVKVTEFHHTGALSVSVGTAMWSPDSSIEVFKATAHVNTPPVGDSLLMNIMVNGLLSHTLALSPGQSSVEINKLGLSLLVTDVVSVNITRVGTTNPGSDLNIKFFTYATS
mgnify:CR=1 FL=1